MTMLAPVAAPRAAAPADAPVSVAAFQYAHKLGAGADGSSDIAMGAIMPNPFQPGAEPFRLAVEGNKPAGVTDAKVASQRMFDPKDATQTAALDAFNTAVVQATDGLKALQSNIDPSMATDKAKSSAWMDAAAPGQVLVKLVLSDGTSLDWAGDWATAPAPLASVLQAYDAAGKTFTAQQPQQG